MTRRFTGPRLVVATHNQGKLAEIAALLARLSGRGRSRPASLGLPEPDGDRGDLRRQRPDQGACRRAGQRPAGARRRFRHRGRRARRRARACTPPTGRTTPRRPRLRAGDDPDLGRAGGERRRPTPRTARFRCTLVLAWPDGHDEVFEGQVEGQCVWPMRGDAGAWLRPDVPARRLCRDLRRDGPLGEEPHQPPRRRLRRAWWRPALPDGLAGRRLRRLCPLAVLRREMPVLRLQQPRARAASTPDRWRRALVAEVAAAAREVPGRVVDTVFFGGGTPSLMPPETVAAVIEAIRGGLDAGRRRRDHAGGQPDLGRGRAVPRLPRRRASTGSRWASRR